MATRVGHVVVFVQENHTTDNYFRWMRAWGANVAADWPLQPNPPARDQPHNRAAYARWLHAQRAGAPSPATRTQFDTARVLPFYAYLAATGAFLENHCSGFGTNSTPNHLLIVGGQSPGRARRCATRRARRRSRCGTCRRCPGTRRSTA